MFPWTSVEKMIFLKFSGSNMQIKDKQNIVLTPVIKEAGSKPSSGILESGIGGLC